MKIGIKEFEDMVLDIMLEMKKKPDYGIVTNISSSGNLYVVTFTTKNSNSSIYLVFYTKHKYNINDTIKFSRK